MAYTRAKVIDPVQYQGASTTFRVIEVGLRHYVCTAIVDRHIQSRLHESIESKISGNFGNASMSRIAIICTSWNKVHVTIHVNSPLQMRNAVTGKLCKYNKKLKVNDTLQAMCKVRIAEIYAVYNIASNSRLPTSLYYYYDTIEVVPDLINFDLIVNLD